MMYQTVLLPTLFPTYSIQMDASAQCFHVLQKNITESVQQTLDELSGISPDFSIAKKQLLELDSDLWIIIYAYIFITFLTLVIVRCIRMGISSIAMSMSPENNLIVYHNRGRPNTQEIEHIWKAQIIFAMNWKDQRSKWIVRKVPKFYLHYLLHLMKWLDTCTCFRKCFKWILLPTQLVKSVICFDGRKRWKRCNIHW